MSTQDNPNLRDMRVSYELDALDESTVPASPIELFQSWLADAVEHSEPEPNAMSLATLGLDGSPNVRTVLLKGLDERGFSFYTNYESTKGKEIAAHPRVALCFVWKERQRQVQVHGTATKLSHEDAAAYFAVRPYGHQIGAWASAQSAVIAGREVLEAAADVFRAKYPEGSEVPCPPHWGGYVVLPEVIDFWQGRRSRLHDRLRFTREGDRWRVERISP